MFSLVLMFLVTGIALAVFLYVGGMFFQGYIYTEPSRDLYWQAPAAGGVLALYFVLWCGLVANAAGVSLADIPYDTLHRFKHRVDLVKEPVPEIWAIKKDGSKVLYSRQRQGQTKYRYVDKRFTPERPWRGGGIESVIITIDGENDVFRWVPGSDGAYGEYVDDKGWAMKEYDDGPTGLPSIFRWSRFLATLALNFGHFLVWWLCLWLLMRFQWSHALGLAVVFWLLFTLIVIPMLLDYTAGLA